MIANINLFRTTSFDESYGPETLDKHQCNGPVCTNSLRSYWSKSSNADYQICECGIDNVKIKKRSIFDIIKLVSC